MNLLLDTTIQIDRATGSKQRKKEIGEVLKGNKLYCSTYVLGEYCNTKDEKAYRGNNCKTLGDTIISLETLKSEWKLGVCTSNKKDFEPICEAVGLELVTPDYSRKK